MIMFSVVIPVYNTEKYLRACIDSLLSQTYANFELLLVDDGSTDRSGKICDDYADRDSRIRVMHIQNGGPARIRNIGIDTCNGDYIWFVDSDDKILPANFLENAEKILTQNRSDILFFLSAEYNSDFSVMKKSQENYLYDGAYEGSGEDLIIALQKADQLLSVATSPVNKMFRRALLKEKGLYFVEHFRWHAEDEFLNKVIFNAERIYFYNREVYQVRIRGNSITTTVSPEIYEKKLYTRIELVDMCCKYFSGHSQREELLKAIHSYYSYYYLFGMKLYAKLESRQSRKNVRKYIKDHPYIFEVMEHYGNGRLKLLCSVKKICGIEVMLRLIVRRYR